MKIDGILSDMNDMSAESFNKLVTSAFTGYIMHKEKCSAEESIRRMGILCEMTQRTIAHSIVTHAIHGGSGYLGGTN